MHVFEKGQAVSILSSSLTGIIKNVSELCITVALDIGGELACSPNNLAPIDKNTNPGQFKEGHPYYPPNPEHEELKADAKDIKQNMLNQLAPFFNNIGRYVSQIRTAEKKIDALAKMAPYVLPALSRVEFTDETPRNLTEEQRLEEYIKQKQQKENNQG